MLDVDFVIAIHDGIIADLGGRPGFAGSGRGGVESALMRINNRIEYAGLNDALGIAGLYAEAIARGHVFTEGIKRTGLTCALSYLAQQNLHVRRDPILEEASVWLAEGSWDSEAEPPCWNSTSSINDLSLPLLAAPLVWPHEDGGPKPPAMSSASRTQARPRVYCAEM